MNADITALPQNIKNAFAQNVNITCVNTAYKTIEEWEKAENQLSKKKTVHIHSQYKQMALNDNHSLNILLYLDN